MKIRNGKIARLPIHIREQLNARLLDNEPGKQLVDWLNAQSEVIAILDSQFEGRLISEQNLSEWRRGGFVAWQFLHECLEHSELASEGAEYVAAIGINSRHLISIITARLGELLNIWAATFDVQTGVYSTNGPMSGKHGSEIAYNQRMLTLQDLLKATLDLRKSEQRDERLALDRERLELLRERQSRKSPSSASSPKSSSAESGPTSNADASSDSSTAEERSAVAAASSVPSVPCVPLFPPTAPTTSVSTGDPSESSFDIRTSSLAECAVIESPRNPHGLL